MQTGACWSNRVPAEKNDDPIAYCVCGGITFFFTGFLSLQQTYSNPSSIEHRNQHHTLGKPDRLESTPNNQKGGDSENRCSGISPFSPVFSQTSGCFQVFQFHPSGPGTLDFGRPPNVHRRLAMAQRMFATCLGSSVRTSRRPRKARSSDGDFSSRFGVGVASDLGGVFLE